MTLWSAVLLGCVWSCSSLTPLTKIAPTAVELEAFAATVVAALATLREMGELTVPHPVVHVVGASNVEAAVDWSPVCAVGATVVLIGPEAVPLVATKGTTTVDDTDGQSNTRCVSVVRALYTRAAVGAALGASSSSVSPDVVSGAASTQFSLALLVVCSA